MNLDSLTEHGHVLLNRFNSRLPQRLQLDAVAHLLPKKELENATLLDIGMPNPVMSALLRNRGGVWATVARSPQHAREAAEFLETNVVCLGADGEIPYDQHAFDVVVVSLGILAAMPDPEAFIKECNRVIKSSGQLIISTQNHKRVSLINTLRRRAEAATDAVFPLSRSFSERELFAYLRTGFDVMSVSSYSRFFVEAVRIHEYTLLAGGLDEDTVCAKVKWLYKLADQLDFFGMGTRGHVLIVQARRRQWRERTVPVLKDGRTMSEAVLSRVDGGV